MEKRCYFLPVLDLYRHSGKGENMGYLEILCVLDTQRSQFYG